MYLCVTKGELLIKVLHRSWWTSSFIDVVNNNIYAYAFVCITKGWITRNSWQKYYHWWTGNFSMLIIILLCMHCVYITKQGTDNKSTTTDEHVCSFICTYANYYMCLCVHYQRCSPFLLATYLFPYFLWQGSFPTPFLILIFLLF